MVLNPNLLIIYLAFLGRQAHDIFHMAEGGVGLGHALAIWVLGAELNRPFYGLLRFFLGPLSLNAHFVLLADLNHRDLLG